MSAEENKADPLASAGNDPGQEADPDPHYEPVIRLTDQVETKTMEEEENVLFKM